MKKLLFLLIFSLLYWIVGLGVLKFFPDEESEEKQPEKLPWCDTELCGGVCCANNQACSSDKQCVDICGPGTFLGRTDDNKNVAQCLLYGYTESADSSAFWAQNKESCEGLNELYPGYKFTWNEDTLVCCPTDLATIFSDATFRTANLCTSCGGTWSEDSIFSHGKCANEPPALPECPCAHEPGKYCPDLNILGGTTSHILKNSDLGYSSGICRDISKADLDVVTIVFNNREEKWYSKKTVSFFDTQNIARALNLHIPSLRALEAVDSATGKSRREMLYEAGIKGIAWTTDKHYLSRPFVLKISDGTISSIEPADIGQKEIYRQKYVPYSQSDEYFDDEEIPDKVFNRMADVLVEIANTRPNKWQAENTHILLLHEK